MQLFQFPITKNPHYVVIKDQRRNSGLTSCRVYKDNLIVACDFNERKAYLVKLSDRGCEILCSHDTIISSGQNVETDLMDARGDTFMVSNFYQGSISFYQISKNSSIRFLEEIDCSPRKKNMHGLRFIPGHDDLVWVTYCGIKNKSHEIWDISKKEIIHSFNADQQCQDIAFLDDYAIVYARTDHIWVNKKPKWWSIKKMYATAYVYKFNDLYSTPPKLISTWRGKGHIDAAMEYQGRIYAANQYLGRVDIFEINSYGRLNLIKSIGGYGMPHGLDIKKGKLYVTDYLDQALKVSTLEEYF